MQIFPCIIVLQYEKVGIYMKFNAKLINTAYEMSTILSFAFSLNFIIINKDMTLSNRLMLILWLIITAIGALKIVINRVVLNKSKEEAFEKALAEIKEIFKGNNSAPIIYILIGMGSLFIKIAIPFMIALI